MWIRNILIAVLSTILIWDFATAPAGDSAAIRFGMTGYRWTREQVSEWHLAERVETARLWLAERIEPASAPDLAETAQVAMPQVMEVIAATDPSYSVFSRNAIQGFISDAAAETGVLPRYLTHLAEKESSFDPVAAAGTSSAKGLYQFIESTWLDLVRRHGASYGLEALAGRIELNDRGRPTVANARLKRQILNLRFDPKFSSLLAAHYTEENLDYLERALGRRPNYAEAYIAHFLGAPSAATLFKARVERPEVSAVDLFPAAARANRVFFYDAQGRGVTVAELYRRLLALCSEILPEDLMATTA